MSRSIGARLPGSLRSLFDGADLAAKEGFTLLLLTTDRNGYPAVAMLSVGEVLSVDGQSLHLVLWPKSSATANLERERAGRATLAMVWAGVAYYIRCSGRRGSDITLGNGDARAYFRLAIDDVLEDAAPYAELTTGVTYRLREPEQVLPRWRETVTLLAAREKPCPA